MSTSAQIEANRANARHSTGPRTPEGKDRVAPKALKHGLNAFSPLVRPNEREAFDSLRRDLRQFQIDRALTVQASKSAKPIPFAAEPTLQDLEDALCTSQPLHTLLSGARR